jgi:hypothetical protein
MNDEVETSWVHTSPLVGEKSGFFVYIHTPSLPREKFCAPVTRTPNASCFKPGNPFASRLGRANPPAALVTLLRR